MVKKHMEGLPWKGNYHQNYFARHVLKWLTCERYQWLTFFCMLVHLASSVSGTWPGGIFWKAAIGSKAFLFKALLPPPLSVTPKGFLGGFLNRFHCWFVLFCSFSSLPSFSVRLFSCAWFKSEAQETWSSSDCSLWKGFSVTKSQRLRATHRVWNGVWACLSLHIIFCSISFPHIGPFHCF